MTNHTKNCQDPAPKATEPAKPTPNGLSEHYGIEAIRSLAREHYNRAVLAERERDAALAEVSSLESQRDELMAALDRERARVDDHKRANTSLEEGLAYQTAEAERLAGQVDELVEEVKRFVCNETCTDTNHIRRRALLARIDAERAGQAVEKPAMMNENGHAADCTCSLCSFTGASGPTERTKELEAAESKGRREAFAEVLRQFETLHCYDTTFLHWLEEAAK